MRSNKKQKSGFTLIELAIVMVAMGLLASAILYGRVMIDQAHIRAIIKAAEDFRTAFDSFEQFYINQPGDMDNAEDFWGSSVTDNGDANGQIEYASGAGNNESLRAWQHLYLAGLISASYTGEADASQTAIPGTNVPKSPYNKGGSVGYTLEYRYIGGEYATTLIVGAAQATGMSDGSAFSPIDAQNIDRKVDDGAPYSGAMLAEGGYITGLGQDPDCTDGSEYATSGGEGENNHCIIFFKFK